MNKFLFVLPILCSSLLFAGEEDAFFTFTTGGETLVKYERYDKANHLKLQALLNGNFKKDNAYMQAALKFTINDGGTLNAIPTVDLDRAIVGYQYELPEDLRVYLEAGRVKMEKIFTSKLQYDSHMNGIHVGFDSNNVSIHGCVHPIEFDKNHYGYVGEVSYTNIMDFPITIAYNITDWTQHSNHLISQICASALVSEYYDLPIEVYAGFLKNHKHSSHSNGGYVGVRVGKIEKANDWSVEANYQHAQDYAVPYYDFKGIGKGFDLKATYAIADNLHLKARAALAEENRFELSWLYQW